MAKPDDRSDNAEKLQNMIENTNENLREANELLEEHGDEMNAQDRAELEAKNQRREESMEGFQSELRDESNQAME